VFGETTRKLLAGHISTVAADQPLDSNESVTIEHRPQQEHLDFEVDDLDTGEAEVLRVGARKTSFQPGETFRVFLDPAGHPFCLVLNSD
jgi:catechol 2,3-dioxygenase-like lactoylglutathione lyase family enzyme